MAKQFIATTLMDGYVDGPHITEVQTGIANQGLYGPDDYVLDEGKKAEAQILTNNSVRVFDATFVIQGRRDVMAANAYADVTIANGEQGMYRNDIIVRKYEKDEMTEIENTSFDVIKGTPSSGVATDPEIPTGDIRTGATMHNMALYRVKLEGLNIVALEPMFKVLYNMADIKKELESLNGKSIIESGKNNNGYYRKYADGTLEMWGTSNTIGSQGAVMVTLPQPCIDIAFRMCANQIYNSSTTVSATSVQIQSKQSFYIYAREPNGTLPASSCKYNWFVVGTWK